MKAHALVATLALALLAPQAAAASTDLPLTLMLACEDVEPCPPVLAAAERVGQAVLAAPDPAIDATVDFAYCARHAFDPGHPDIYICHYRYHIALVAIAEYTAAEVEGAAVDLIEALRP